MNPFLERHWPDVHSRLIGYIADAIATRLPADLNSRAEEGISITMDDEGAAYRPAVAVTEEWKEGAAPAWTPEIEDGQPAIAEPVIVQVPEITPRWVEIRADSGRLVTVLEVLSPWNKRGQGTRDYRIKQDDYLKSGINLVEIDLLRGGSHVLSFNPDRVKPVRLNLYAICVARTPNLSRREVYPFSLRKRLPVIGVPLREQNADVPLDLQPLIDRCYEMGRYWKEDFSADLDPPLQPEDKEWVEQRLREAELID